MKLAGSQGDESMVESSTEAKLPNNDQNHGYLN